MSEGRQGAMNLTSDEFREWLRCFRDECRWQAAMSGLPHEYTVRNWRPEADDDFLKAASGIREFGDEQNFYQSTYVYFDLDGMKYWTMGEPLNETVVLNRTSVENRYDAPAARGAEEHEESNGYSDAIVVDCDRSKGKVSNEQCSTV